MKKKYIVYFICIATILFSLFRLTILRQSTRDNEVMYERLAEQKGKEDTLPERSDSGEANPWIKELFHKNQDFLAWIEIPGTRIDYPVVQSKEEPDYYLTHNFEKKEEKHGVPFLDEHCNIGESDNLIIYGHHMRDGSMFADLMKYKEEDFGREHEEIFLSTLERTDSYHIFCVMVMSMEDIEEFPFYQWPDFSSQELFEGYLSRCQQYACWQNQERPVYGDPLLTLTTCEYSHENGRLVVIASRKEENE